MSNKFNFQEAREKAIKAADQELEQGLKQIAEQGAMGSGTSAPSEQVQEKPMARELAATAAQQTVTVQQEPMQNINIPIPLNQHMRLAVIKAHTRQNIKDLVVQAIALWLDVQEGKKSININQQ